MKFKNVYFINGNAYAGKSTMIKLLAEKYNGIACCENYHDELIDEVLVSVMKAPRTFTAEDTVEINTHGGISPTNKTLELLLESGCRLAEPVNLQKEHF